MARGARRAARGARHGVTSLLAVWYTALGHIARWKTWSYLHKHRTHGPRPRVSAADANGGALLLLGAAARLAAMLSSVHDAISSILPNASSEGK